MNAIDVYRQILRDSVSDDMDVVDVLLHMVVLHTHTVVLSHGVELDDVSREEQGEPLVLYPLTRTHVANIVASLWPKGATRGEEDFWWHEYCKSTPCEVFGDLPRDLQDRAEAARRRIGSHYLVSKLVED